MIIKTQQLSKSAVPTNSEDEVDERVSDVSETTPGALVTGDTQVQCSYTHPLVFTWQTLCVEGGRVSNQRGRGSEGYRYRPRARSAEEVRGHICGIGKLILGEEVKHVTDRYTYQTSKTSLQFIISIEMNVHPGYSRVSCAGWWVEEYSSSGGERARGIPLLETWRTRARASFPASSYLEKTWCNEHSSIYRWLGSMWTIPGSRTRSIIRIISDFNCYCRNFNPLKKVEFVFRTLVDEGCFVFLGKILVRDEFMDEEHGFRYGYTGGE